MKIRMSCDLEEAGRIWQELWPAEDVFGCWEVRECFQKSFGHNPHFIIAESNGRPAGFIGLSWIAEQDGYGQFPGETWQGRTWFEQNRIPAESDIMRRRLWEAAPEGTTLRYLIPDSATVLHGASIDEMGYILRPPQFGFEFDKYWELFSGKSRKKINREINGLGTLEYLYEGWTPGDIEWMLNMNKANFGNRSYFDDQRFLEGFEKMLSVLSEMKKLHVTSVSVGGRLAAVDIGAVFGGRYTVLAGAVDPEFQGIAKAINLFHIRWGCSNRLEQIDFLCGDFGWKERFHLERRALFTSTRNVFDRSKPVSTERKASGAPAY